MGSRPATLASNSDPASYISNLHVKQACSRTDPRLKKTTQRCLEAGFWRFLLVLAILFLGSISSLNGEENKEGRPVRYAVVELGSTPDASEVGNKTHQEMPVEPDNLSTELLPGSRNGNISMEDKEVTKELHFQLPTNEGGVVPQGSAFDGAKVHESTGFKTIHIVSEALPKIVPYVLINHREELLPLIMCAIECHPDSGIRDSLTHTLFNLIKRSDEQQRKIIMDACVTLARNVGEMRTETELLPQCWEQINHKNEERRLLVAQSCGLLAEFVRPEIRDSLILSIVQQLVEDSATVVREAAAHNLALLLPLFPNVDKYSKVEELMFQLGCDPSGLVVETTLKELVHAVVKWGNKVDHMLRVLRSHILNSAQRCPPVSGVEGSVDSQLRLLGEQERWNISVLLRLLSELLPYVHQNTVETYPFSSAVSAVISPKNPELGTTETLFFSKTLLDLYAGCTAIDALLCFAQVQ